MQPLHVGRNRRRSSPLEHYRHHGQPSATPVQKSEPADALSWFWAIIEAETATDVRRLWPGFQSRAAELRQLGRSEDLREILIHLGLALDQNDLWNERALQELRAAILRALRAGGN
jgi:hypothetical protein